MPALDAEFAEAVDDFGEGGVGLGLGEGFAAVDAEGDLEGVAGEVGGNFVFEDVFDFGFGDFGADFGVVDDDFDFLGREAAFFEEFDVALHGEEAGEVACGDEEGHVGFVDGGEGAGDVVGAGVDDEVVADGASEFEEVFGFVVVEVVEVEVSVWAGEEFESEGVVGDEGGEELEVEVSALGDGVGEGVAGYEVEHGEEVAGVHAVVDEAGGGFGFGHADDEVCGEDAFACAAAGGGDGDHVGVALGGGGH